MIGEPAIMGRHRRELTPGGYVTAWSGDLNSDLPTVILPILEPERARLTEFAEPTIDLLQAVLDGLRHL